MIVEEQGIDFRTGVRFPSAPLKNPSAIDFKTTSGWIFYFQDRYSCFLFCAVRKIPIDKRLAWNTGISIFVSLPAGGLPEKTPTDEVRIEMRLVHCLFEEKKQLTI